MRSDWMDLWICGCVDVWMWWGGGESRRDTTLMGGIGDSGLLSREIERREGIGDWACCGCRRESWVAEPHLQTEHKGAGPNVLYLVLWNSELIARKTRHTEPGFPIS